MNPIFSTYLEKLANEVCKRCTHTWKSIVCSELLDGTLHSWSVLPTLKDWKLEKNPNGLFWLFFYKIEHFWLFSNQIGYFHSLRVGNTVPDLVKESIIVGDLFAFANGASGPNDAWGTIIIPKNWRCNFLTTFRRRQVLFFELLVPMSSRSTK